MSELSKPEQFDAEVEIHGGEPFAVWAPAVNGSHVKAEVYFALLADLKAKDKRIAELEAKMAAPVVINLPERRSDSHDWGGVSPTEAFNTCRSICGLMFRQQLRGQGFIVEGDE